MKLAVITDSTAVLPHSLATHEDLYVLDIPIMIEGQSYIEGKNLTLDDFYQKMAASDELPKTSQPSLAELDDLLSVLPSQGYTHVIGLFLSSGISGFWQNIQFLIDEHSEMTIAFPDSKITSAPLGSMVENTLAWAAKGDDFITILDKLAVQIDKTSAFIMVDDLNHLVKGGVCQMALLFWEIFCPSSLFSILIRRELSLFMKKCVRRRRPSSVWLRS